MQMPSDFTQASTHVHLSSKSCFRKSPKFTLQATSPHACYNIPRSCENAVSICWKSMSQCLTISHNVSQWTKMIAGHPYCFRCFPPAFVPAFAIRRRRALCSFPFSIFPKAWGTNDLHIAPKLNSIRRYPKYIFQSVLWIFAHSPPRFDLYLCRTLSHIPGIVLRWPILRHIWYFLLHDASYPFLVLSTTAQQIEIQTPTLWPTITWSAKTSCKDSFLKAKHPTFTIFCINRNILQQQSLKVQHSGPCLASCLCCPCCFGLSIPSPSLRPDWAKHVVQTCQNVPQEFKKTESICDSRYILHHPSWFACSIHGPSMVHPWSIHGPSMVHASQRETIIFPAFAPGTLLLTARTALFVGTSYLDVQGLPSGWILR